jgi:hypothetical protein
LVWAGKNRKTVIVLGAGATRGAFHHVLAFLAPTIVEAIATGHQPVELTAKALTERIELPLLWSEQERSVGIN